MKPWQIGVLGLLGLLAASVFCLLGFFLGRGTTPPPPPELLVQPTATLVSPMESPPTPTPPSPSPPIVNELVQVGNLNWQPAKGGQSIYITADVHNATDKTVCFVQVHIQLLDDQGNIVAMDSGYADQKCIPAGATSVFKLFTPYRPGVTQVRIGYVAWQWSSE